ncbi:MAG TPA: 2Fe-2S iron-sulfur cluster-binding protein [Chloroflexia bacterium]|nr:2Fe-2S iron-sulfur cluster-binding protein [Chloroflexia bacterium]
MASLVINNVKVEATPGEDLLSVARRNRAHIGFVCDGNGLCTTCECKILSGAENLTPANEVERNWLPPDRLRRGYRLGCQTYLKQDGNVRVLTRAEEIRRLWAAMFNPPAGSSGVDSLNRFLGYVVELNLDHLSNFPQNLLNTVSRLGLMGTIMPVRNGGRWAQDVGAIIDTQTEIDTTAS